MLCFGHLEDFFKVVLRQKFNFVYEGKSHVNEVDVSGIPIYKSDMKF